MQVYLNAPDKTDFINQCVGWSMKKSLENKFTKVEN